MNFSYLIHCKPCHSTFPVLLFSDCAIVESAVLIVGPGTCTTSNWNGNIRSTHLVSLEGKILFDRLSFPFRTQSFWIFPLPTRWQFQLIDAVLLFEFREQSRGEVRGFPLIFYRCCRTAAKPSLLASQMILRGKSFLNRLFSVISFMARFNFMDVSSSLSPHYHSLSFFSNGLSGAYRFAKLGINRFIWLFAPMKERKTLQFFGRSLSVFAWTFF